MSKAETKWGNQTKISVPILTDFEKTQIDNNFDSIVNQFIKQLVHEKELATAQHIIRKQKEYIQQLEIKEQKVIEKLERDIKIYSQKGCCRKQVREGIVREAKEILEIMKGEE